MTVHEPSSVFNRKLDELRMIQRGQVLTARLLNEPRMALNDLLRGTTPPRQVPSRPGPAVSGALSFCVVRNLLSDDILEIAILEVGDGGALTIDTATVEARPWPPLHSRHYRGFLWFGDTIQEHTNVLPVVDIGGELWVQQMLTYGVLDLQSEVQISDCQV